MAPRKVLLLTIGAPPLPSVTAVVPVSTTDTVSSYTAPPLAPPSALVIDPIIDGALASWTASAEAGVEYIIQTAPDVSGTPGSWTIFGSAGTDLTYNLALPDGPRWVRVYAALNGRVSDPLTPVLATPKAIPGGAYNQNLLVNAGLTVSAAGWDIGTNTAGGGWLLERDARTLSDRVPGTHTIALRNAGSPGSGSIVGRSSRVSAVEDEWYYFSGWLADEDCAGKLWWAFEDAAGTVLASGVSATTTGTGGNIWAGHQRLAEKQQAPTGTLFARVGLQVTVSGGSAPIGWLTQPMLEHAKADQDAPSNWHMGGAEGLAEYTLNVDNDGRIASIALRSDGTESAIDFLADNFSITDPDGTDALQWSGGVISADKDTKSVKIGPGFGSDASSHKLILYFGDGGSNSTRSRAGARVFIAEDGVAKLGNTQVNFTSGWSSGAAVTYSAAAGTPATATISVAAGTFSIGGIDISYAASSANVTGTNGTSTTYFLYYDDPGLVGGSQTLYASTDNLDTYANDGHVMVGAVTVAFPASGSGSGGGGSPGGGGGLCPSVEAWVISLRGPIRAGDVDEGDMLLLCDPDTGIETWGRVTYSRHKRAAGVRLTVESGGTLTCSRTAPIPTERGYRNASDTLGLHVPTRRGSAHAAPVVTDVADVGLIDVQHITVGDRCFWTGDDGSTFLLHHNMKPIDFDP